MIASKSMLFFPRYGLMCVIGVAGGLALVLFRAAGGSHRAGWMMVTFLMAWLVMARGREAASSAYDPHSQFEERTPVLLKALTDGPPVVMNDPLLFLESDFYAPAAVVGRLSYLELDRVFRRNYPWQDVSDQLVEYVARYLPLRAHVEPWQAFSLRNERFLLHTHGAGRRGTRPGLHLGELLGA
jgi:hypothetical protein